MPECQFRVSAIFGFRKSYMENIVKLGGNLFLRKYNIRKLSESEDHLGWRPQGPTPHGGVAWGGAAPSEGVVALAGLRLPSFAYIFPPMRKP